MSAAAKVAREHSLTFDQVSAMDAAAIDNTFFPREGRGPDPAYLRPDMAALVERKKANRKLPVKLMWAEHCEQAAAEFFYHRDWDGVTLEGFMSLLDDYLACYDEERPKESLGWVSPARARAMYYEGAVA